MPLPPGYNWTNKVQDYTNYDYSYKPPSREDIDADKADYQSSQEMFSQWDWQNQDGIGPQGEALPQNAIGWKPNGEADYGTGLKGWWSKATSKVGEAWQTGYQEGVKISGLGALATGIQAGATGKDANELLKEKEAGRKPENENQALWSAATEATKEIFNQALWGVLDGLAYAGQASEQVIGTAGYTLADAIDPNRDVNEQTFKENWNASRMAYSGIFDASIYNEMNRRIEDGTRGDLAAQEIMIAKPWTMWPELIGQIIFDPLNVISAFGKAGQAARLQKSVAKTFHEVANPAVAKMLDDLADISKLDDATAYRRVEELVKSQQALTTAASHAEDIAQAGKDLETLSQSYKLSSLTRDGKVAHLANQTGEIMMHVVNNSSPDEALEIIRGMVLSASPDASKAAEGVSAMLHFADPQALFSKAGNNTTVLLSRMVEKHGDNWLKNLDALKGKPVDLTKDLLGKLDEVGEEMFPSVSKMLEAEKTVKAGGEVSEATKALAERAKALPEYVKSATRFHDNAQKVVGPINKFFIGAYMGWSPGYAFRNFTNNSLQLLIDYGPGVLLGNADNMFAKVENLHGGIIQGAFSEGGQVASLFPDASKVGVKETGVKAIFGAMKEKGLSGPVLGMSQKLEANAAKRIIAKTYTQTFEKGTKAMVKALTPDLKAAGFSDDIIKKLPTYIMQNDGDATKVINALRADVNSGVIDVFNDISRIDPKYKSFLSDAGKWDEYADTVLKASTREEAEVAAKKIFDELAQAGDYAYRDGRPAVDNYDKFLKMAEGSGMPETRGQLISLRKTESRKAIQTAESILSEADDLGAQMGLQVGTMKKARGITGLNTWGNDAAKEADRINDIAWKLTKEAKGKGNLQQLWMAYPELFPGTPPANMDVKTFLDALWHNYDQVTSKVWGGARDTAIGNVTGYLDDLKTAGVEVPQQWKDVIKTAQEGAQQYDTAKLGRFGELVEDTIEAYGTRTSQISQVASRFGIASATAEGVATDKKILQTINKYADVNYKSLEDVPLNVAEEAFAKKAGKATKAVQPELKATGVTMDEATKVPRSELPEEVSQRIASEAKRLQSELFGGEAGKRTAEGTTKSTNVSWYRELFQKGMTKPVIDKALDKIVMDAGADKGVNVERMKDFIMDTFRYGDKTNGVPPDLKALQSLGADEKTLAAALDDYNDITKQEKTLEELLGTGDEGGQLLTRDPDLPYFDDAGNLVEPSRKRILPPSTDGEMPTISRAIKEQMGDVGKMRAWVMDDITKNFGKKQLVDKVTEGALKNAEKELTQKLAENRLIASRVSQANRDFTLLNYGDKSYWDVALAYLYPFHFWYGGTYKNWMTRLATNPAVLAHYSKYKETLGTVHAGMPEWYKYNINTNDLPGVNVENPLFFNLEATLWPLNGLTNTDFNDPAKKVNWWTSTLDFANKFGPSTWSPINMVTGLALYAQGEKEAGERWMGRLFPQSNVIKAGASLLGKANLETDPFVSLLQGGLDPYERRRVGRALAEMEQLAAKGELPYTAEQIQDAAYSQEGEIWDEAVRRAVRGRAPSQISSYLFGVGFKGRTQEDAQVDQFYSDYNRLFMMRPNLSPEEFREGMDEIKKKYPFGDTVLLSRRTGLDRDAGLAYSVLNRIPPGATSEIFEAVGLSSDLVNKFFDSKGLEKLSLAEQKKFMSGILDMAAVLEIPTDMTRSEWTKAKNAYSGLTKEAKNKFGADILDQVDTYYAKKTISGDAANAFLDDNPAVSEYMEWRQQRIINSPLLSSYYGGASMVENYYRSQMYNDIEQKVGKDIFDIVSDYQDLKTWGSPSEAKTFYRQHKAAISQYYDIKEAWQLTINQETARISAYLPEGEGAGIREDFDSTSVGAQNLADSLQPQEQMTMDDFNAVIPDRLMGLISDYIVNGERLPETAETQLSRIANEMGYQDVDDLLQNVGAAMYSQQP
jgi:hypothetical protein